MKFFVYLIALLSISNAYSQADHVINFESIDSLLTYASDPNGAIFFTAGNTIKTQGYHSPNDGGGAFYTIELDSTSTDNEDIGDIRITPTLVAKFTPYGQVSIKQFGAVGNGADDDTDAIQNCINTFESVFIPSTAGGFRTTRTITINKSIVIDCNGSIRPDTNVIVGVRIGGYPQEPSKIRISGLKVERGISSRTAANDNIGFEFLEVNQSSFYDLESRFSRTNFKISPKNAGFSYNNFFNLQAIGGFYNIHFEISGPGLPGYANENKFFGGRGFGLLANSGVEGLHTHLYLEGQANHNSFNSMSLEGEGEQSIYCASNENIFYFPRTEGNWVIDHIVLSNEANFNSIFSTRAETTILDSGYPNTNNQFFSYRGHQYIGSTIDETVSEIIRTAPNTGIDSCAVPATVFSDIGSNGHPYIMEFNHLSETPHSYVFKSKRASDDLVRSSLTTNGKLFLAGSLRTEGSSNTAKPLIIGDYYLWVDPDGNLRIKNGPPQNFAAGQYEGVVVGSQQ